MKQPAQASSSRRSSGLLKTSPMAAVRATTRLSSSRTRARIPDSLRLGKRAGRVAAEILAAVSRPSPLRLAACLFARLLAPAGAVVAALHPGASFDGGYAYELTKLQVSYCPRPSRSV